MEAACAPFQFALSTGAGKMSARYCPTVVRGRTTTSQFSHQVRGFRIVLVCEVYLRPNTYVWTDGTGTRHQIPSSRGRGGRGSIDGADGPASSRTALRRAERPWKEQTALLMPFLGFHVAPPWPQFLVSLSCSVRSSSCSSRSLTCLSRCS